VKWLHEADSVTHLIPRASQLYASLPTVIWLPPTTWRRRFNQAINQLPQSLRQVMQLRARGATHQEISEETGMGLSTVRKDIQLAKEKLKALLDDTTTPDRKE
jgi:DNA-directed RNA polymerase specialized sigma24 family protein